MKSTLIGYTGFVGSNLASQHVFDRQYNSKNIDEAFKEQHELVIYSGVRAEKFLANKHPEQDREIINQAKENIVKAWLEKYITLIHGQALDIIPTFEKEIFDFIFIDWMKRRSKDFLELSLPKVKKWWIIVIDDVVKFKDKMESLYEYVKVNKIPYEVVMIDEDDWIMKIIKST